MDPKRTAKASASGTYLEDAVHAVVHAKHAGQPKILQYLLSVPKHALHESSCMEMQ